mgnify:CR=1 FL=1
MNNNIIRKSEVENDGDISPKAPLQATLSLPDPVLNDYYTDLNNRIVWITQNFGDTCIDALHFILQCNIEDYGKSVDERRPIIIYIVSNGGSVEAMQSLIGCIQASKTPVATVNICTAYSAAAMVLSAGTKGYRYALRNTNTMIHLGYTSIQGTNGQVDSAKKFFDALDKRNMEDLFKRTSIDAKRHKAIMHGDDVYFTEDDAIACGIVDHVIDNLDDLLWMIKQQEK